MKRLTILLTAMFAMAHVASADIWDDLAKYKMSEEIAPPPVKIHEIMINTSADQMGAIEDKFLKILNSNDATDEAKWFSCRMLQRIGTEKSIPTLSKLLTDETMSHYARLTLEKLSASKSAGKALLSALPKAPDHIKIGIIGTIGERGDQNAIKTISKYASSDNVALSKAALMALGKIGGKKALSAISKAKVVESVKSERMEALKAAALKIKDPGNIYISKKGKYPIYVTNDGKPGWKCEYFNGGFDTAPVLTRIQKSVVSNWEQKAPDSKVKKDNFKMRASGTIVPTKTRKYTITGSADDSLKVLVDDKTVIDTGLDKVTSGSVDLVAGKEHKIVVEFAEGGGHAWLQLAWDSVPKEYMTSKQQTIVDVALAQKYDSMIAAAESAGDASAIEEVYKTAKTSAAKGAALSALVRVDENKGISLLVEALKGSTDRLVDSALTILVNEKGALLTKSAAGAISKCPNKTQAKLIAVLGIRGDKAALSEIKKFAASKDDAVSVAAINAAALLGDGSTVPLILSQATGSKKDAVTKAMAKMTAPSADTALISALKNSTISQAAAAAIAKRGASVATPALELLAKNGSDAEKKAAWAALGAVAKVKDLDELMKMKLANTSKVVDRSAVKAIKDVCAREGDKDSCMRAILPYYDKADEKTKCFILDAAAVSGGHEGIKYAKGALESGNKTLYDKAVRALASWDSARHVYDILLDLAQNTPEDINKIIALRGYIDQNSKDNNKQKFLERLNKAKPLIKRKEEKMLIISSAGSKREEYVVPFIFAYVDDPEVKTEARMALLNKTDNLIRKRKAPSEIRETLDKIVNDADSTEDAVKQAKGFLNRIKREIDKK